MVPWLGWNFPSLECCMAGIAHPWFAMSTYLISGLQNTIYLGLLFYLHLQHWRLVALSLTGTTDINRSYFRCKNDCISINCNFFYSSLLWLWTLFLSALQWLSAVSGVTSALCFCMPALTEARHVSGASGVSSALICFIRSAFSLHLCSALLDFNHGMAVGSEANIFFKGLFPVVLMLYLFRWHWFAHKITSPIFIFLTMKTYPYNLELHCVPY